LLMVWGILVVYNISLTLLSLYMFYELVTGLWEGGHNFFCQDTHSGGDADMKIICVLWWYYFSKLIEFMDTFFFILRKNSHQITVLDVYHHASLLNIWWFVMNWVPCGHSYFGATLNSFIHVLMFSYYGLSAIAAMRPYLWWKKYITQCQLTQCVLTMTQTSCAMVWCSCNTAFFHMGNHRRSCMTRKDYQNVSVKDQIPIYVRQMPQHQICSAV
uniref:Elongation of very long chain fatty acids protein n=1 Tax=Leptobrachium leishanense TaxID=445787 RepID=A0A8C5QFB0_9ANUR